MIVGRRYIFSRDLVGPIVFSFASVISVLAIGILASQAANAVETDCLYQIPSQVWWKGRCTGINDTLLTLDMEGCETASSTIKCLTNNNSSLLPGEIECCWYRAIDASCASAGKTLEMNVVFREPAIVKEYVRYKACLDALKSSLHITKKYIGALLPAFLPFGIITFLFLVLVLISANKFEG
jgi:hypothetical protein